jgi:hypothetical protein
LDQGGFVLAADHVDRIGAEHLADLHGKNAQPARRSPHQHVVAGGHLGLVHEHSIGGEIGQSI